MIVVVGIPYASLYINDVAHDDSGRRIKTMDSHLSHYLTQASKQSNTLTVLLSDHGNTYGKFVEETQQGRHERYHPLLYLIVPKGAQAILGKLHSVFSAGI